jgi:hypothetical protein
MSAHRLLLGVALGLVMISLGLSAAGSAGASITPQIPTPSVTPTYATTFSESGLPSGTNWSVHVAFIGCGCEGVHETVYSTTSTIVTSLANGSYRYHVLVVPGYAVVGAARGIVNVTGASPPTISVTFAPVTRYAVEFTETGLPSGTDWSVQVTGNGKGQIRAFEDASNSSTGSAMSFSLPNATYHYTVGSVPGSFFLSDSHGVFVVSGSSLPPILVEFVTPPTYSVSFLESGLLMGLSWSVAIHGQSLSPSYPIHQASTSTGTTVSFSLPNGTYHYVVAEVLGYDLESPARGTLTVAGAVVTTSVAFRQIGVTYLYLVDFNETGLASGTSWSVHVAATHDFGPGSRATGTSASGTVAFGLQNGTYRFHVPPIAHYTQNVTSGTVTVAGAAAPTVFVKFTPIATYDVTFNETGLPNGTVWSVLVYTQAGTSAAWRVHATEASNTTQVVFAVPNGTYCYKIHPVHGWEITTGSMDGTFPVSGSSPPTVYVVYSPR